MTLSDQEIEFWIFKNEAPTFMENGRWDEIKNDYVKAFIDEVSQWNDGSIYGIPLTKSTEVVYVNETLLGTLGYTMNDLKNLTMDGEGIASFNPYSPGFSIYFDFYNVLPTGYILLQSLFTWIFYLF